MNSVKRFILAAVILTFSTTLAHPVQGSNPLKVSGGEDHTLVLAENSFVWSCGPNGGYTFGHYYYGVLGTGSDVWALNEVTLIQVHGGAMGTPHLQDINNIAAGWKHSLALDVNGFV